MRRALVGATLFLAGCAAAPHRAPAAHSAVDERLPATAEEQRREIARLAARIEAARAAVDEALVARRPDSPDGEPSGGAPGGSPAAASPAPTPPPPVAPPPPAATRPVPEEQPRVAVDKDGASERPPARSDRCRRIDAATFAICDAARRIARLADALADDESHRVALRADEDCRLARSASERCR